MIKRAVEESLAVKAADTESEGRLNAIRKLLLDAQGIIVNVVGPD
jgi:hypothetical protein